MKLTLLLAAFLSIYTTFTVKAYHFNHFNWERKGKNTVAQRDTFDPEQRLPEGVSYPVPKRIPAIATTEPFESRVDPMSWWIGFKDPSVELMIHDRNIHDHAVVIRHAGVTIKKIDRPENHNYLFVTLHISPTTKPGTLKINLVKGKDRRSFDWTLSRRSTDPKRNQGINASDFIYLLMPDRFANGDYSNDSYPNMYQTGIDRRKMYFRHGGDLKGIADHLDYIQDLGVTALWLNPVQENDQPFESYHGYSITDMYRIDRRLGTNEDYKNLTDKCHARGMKMVMDVVPNHVGDKNYFIKDLPESNWIHQYDTFTQTNYRDQIIFDPYAAESDRAWSQDGWFVKHMPDLNPEGNKHLENYIIQNHLWWLEYAGVDGFRIDTYFYNDLRFMSRWAKRLRQEFPRLHLFGETWVRSILNQAHSTEGVRLPKPFDSNMQGVTDFQLYFAIIEALTKPQGWNEGVLQLYQNLANDIIYKNPNANVTFLDNHDLPRMYSVLNEDMARYKSAIIWLLTTRGVPQWYYGAELAFKGFTDPDGKVRQDMPGGWKEDTRNVFKESGRTELENEVFNFVKKMATWRKTKTCLHDGKTTQFLPVDGVYVYFRYDAKGIVMVAMNTNDKKVNLDTRRFKERINGITTAKDIITGKSINIGNIELERYETKVLELK